MDRISKVDASLKRYSMSERVKQELLRKIMSGEIAPGSRLVELQLAREFNTSQGPVREALRELEGMKLVTNEPYKGMRVREVTVADIREAYLVRAALEELAARLAAPRLRAGIQELKKVANAALAAARLNKVTQYNQHNIQFHAMIVEASENRTLVRTWKSLSFEVHIQIRLLRDRVDLVAAQESHWPVLEALDKGEAAKAGKLLRDHILNSLPAQSVKS